MNLRARVSFAVADASDLPTPVLTDFSPSWFVTGQSQLFLKCRVELMRRSVSQRGLRMCSRVPFYKVG